ncbi:MAG: serine hydrolase domain-containing protein [Actinomycetes bacterium]
MSRPVRSRTVARIAAGVSAVLVTTVLATVSTTGAVAGSTPQGTRDGAGLTRALERLVAMPGGPPGAVAVVHRGHHRTVYTAGVANVTTQRHIRVSDHMRIASIAKAFSGAVALTLVDRGRLSLRDTIGERLPYLPDAWGNVTLGQMLQHTSGLPDYTKNKKFLERATAHPLVPLPPRQLLAFVKSKPLVFTPGSRYEYSNSDNIAVALMVEAVTGRPYARVMHRLVSKPLDLVRTSLPTGARLPRPFIHGYAVEPGQPLEDLSEVLAAGLTFASGGVVSTPADLDRFIRGYAGARLFGRDVQAKQLRLVDGESDPPGPGVNSAGLGIFRYETRCGTVYGHTGNFPGYTQFAASTLDGHRSVTLSVSRQLRPDVDPVVFGALRRADVRAVCAALR